MLENHISKQEAMRRIREHWHPAPSEETVAIDDACGRFIAEDARARFDIPVVRAAGMDGICVNFDLFEEGIPDASGWTRGIEYERADTGDDFDDRFDTVLPIEWIEPVDENARCGDRILLQGGIRIEPKAGPGGPGRGPAGHGAPKGPEGKGPGGPQVSRGMNVRPAGSQMKRDTLLLKAGMKITTFDIAALVSGGYDMVRVTKKPVISFIPTGSELVSAGQPLQRGQNYDANSHLARVMLEEIGATPRIYSVVKDKKTALADTLQDALAASDIVIINGGSSKGDEDFNTELLEASGQLLFHWIKAAPGRPMAAAVTEDGKLILNVAGPTLAAYYGIVWCVRELVSDWYGAEIPWGREVTATAGRDLPAPPLSILMKMKVTEAEDGTLTAIPMGGPGGPGRHGDPGNGRSQPLPFEANAIYFTTPDEKPVREGDPVTVLLVR